MKRFFIFATAMLLAVTGRAQTNSPAMQPVTNSVSDNSLVSVSVPDVTTVSGYRLMNVTKANLSAQFFSDAVAKGAVTNAAGTVTQQHFSNGTNNFPFGASSPNQFYGLYTWEFGAAPSLPDYILEIFSNSVVQNVFEFTPNGGLVLINLAGTRSGFSDSGSESPGFNNFTLPVAATNTANTVADGATNIYTSFQTFASATNALPVNNGTWFFVASGSVVITNLTVVRNCTHVDITFSNSLATPITNSFTGAYTFAGGQNPLVILPGQEAEWFFTLLPGQTNFFNTLLPSLSSGIEPLTWISTTNFTLTFDGTTSKAFFVTNGPDIFPTFAGTSGNMMLKILTNCILAGQLTNNPAIFWQNGTSNVWATNGATLTIKSWGTNRLDVTLTQP